MLFAVLLTVTIMGVWRPEELALLIAIFAAGLLGFIDDGAKVIFHRSLGLGAIAKLVSQFIVSTAFIIYAVNFLGISSIVSIPFIVDIDLGVLSTQLPIFGGITIPWLYLIFIDILIVGMCNATNLTDGLDGLATGSGVIVMVVMAAISFKCDALGPSIIAASMAGACIGFLWHNAHPADIFMGDTGSLALGMGFGCLSVLTKTEFLSIIIGGLFVIEALSSLIQMISIIYFKKKVFKMAPLHHHFEKLGWEETDIVKLFWTVGLLLAMIAILFGVWI